jgi:capsid portal protein
MNWIKKQLANLFLSDYIGSSVRGLLKWLGGILTAYGAFPTQNGEELCAKMCVEGVSFLDIFITVNTTVIAGLVVFTVGQLLSFKAKK